MMRDLAASGTNSITTILLANSYDFQIAKIAAFATRRTADGHGLRDAALQALKQIHWSSNWAAASVAAGSSSGTADSGGRCAGTKITEVDLPALVRSNPDVVHKSYLRFGVRFTRASHPFSSSVLAPVMDSPVSNPSPAKCSAA